jgi:hypothetical protein
MTFPHRTRKKKAKRSKTKEGFEKATPGGIDGNYS